MIMQIMQSECVHLEGQVGTCAFLKSEIAVQFKCHAGSQMMLLTLIFKPLPFLHRKREMLAYFGYFVANLRIMVSFFRAKQDQLRMNDSTGLDIHLRSVNCYR